MYYYALNLLLNQYFINKKYRYTTGPGQAVINPAYIIPNESNTGNQIFVSGFLPTTGDSNYYTISTGYPFPPLVPSDT